MSKVLPYVSDALFDMLDFSEFPRFYNFFFFLQQFEQDEKCSYHLGFHSLAHLRLDLDLKIL